MVENARRHSGRGRLCLRVIGRAGPIISVRGRATSPDVSLTSFFGSLRPWALQHRETHDLRPFLISLAANLVCKVAGAMGHGPWGGGANKPCQINELRARSSLSAQSLSSSTRSANVPPNLHPCSRLASQHAGTQGQGQALQMPAASVPRPFINHGRVAATGLRRRPPSPLD